MINLSSNDQEEYLNQISKAFEHQSNLIKIYPSSKNFSKCFLDTSALISLLKFDLLIPSNYYLLYTDICDLLQETIEMYIRENISKGIKVKYIYESVQQSQYLIPRLYLMIICGSIYLELYPIKYKEIILDLLNAVKCVQNPLRGFWLRNFLFKNLKNILPIKTGEYIYNKEYFYIYRDISLYFLMTNLEELSLFAMRIKKEIFIDDKKIDEKQRINMISCIEETIEEISNIKGLDKNLFVNKLLPKMFDIICKMEDKKDYYLEQIIFSALIKYFNIELYFESQGISIIFLILRKIIDNKEIDKASIFNNLLNNYIKFMKKLKKNDNVSLKNENISIILNTFPLFVEKYMELQATYKNSEEKEFNKFIELDSIFMKFSLKVLKNGKDEQKISVINIVLNSCSKRLNMYNYGFKIETIKKICSLIEIPLKYKFTVFEFPIIETMIYYLDYNHRKHISLKLIDSFENNSNNRYKIDSIEKIQKIINLIIPLISEEKGNNLGEESCEYFDDEEEKNKYLCKLVYILDTKNPEIVIKILNKIKTFLNSGTLETNLCTFPTLIYFIIGYMKKLELFYNEYFSKNKYMEKAKKENVPEIELSISNKDDYIFVESYFINIIKDLLKILKECILIIENKNQIKAFKLYLIAFCQITKINYIFKSKKNLLDELYEDYIKKIIYLYKNFKEEDNKYKMFQYLCGYLHNISFFLEKEKMKNIFEFLEKEFPQFNDSKIKFNIAINICDLYFYTVKDKEMVEKYINQALQVSNTNLFSFDNINLLINLINKILSYMENDYRPNYIEIINKAIKQLKNTNFLINGVGNEGYKETYNHYENTIKYITKKKIQKSNSIYNSIIL